MLTLLAIFLPAWFLVIGALPFWNWLRSREEAQAALRGINAAVVGILLATLYTPVLPVLSWRRSTLPSRWDASLCWLCGNGRPGWSSLLLRGLVGG